MTGPQDAKESPAPEAVPFRTRLKWILIGPPRDLGDRSIYHQLSLIPFLAWVGLGADGLSSSAYGPAEAFKNLGEHPYLAVGLAGLTALTVLIISAGYSQLIEKFPHGGGGYLVATKLLGPHAGVLSGSALLVDYVLTITASIAAAGDALFSFDVLQPWIHWKLPVEIFLVVFMTGLNLRGVRESVITLTPVFILFVVTHVILILGAIIGHASQFPATVHMVRTGFSEGLSQLGAWSLLMLFVRAYSLGGGTYTGIEAVSNGLAIMREPRIRTAKRTMLYMAASLALTASGLLVCYLLWNIRYDEHKTMNALLVERLVQSVPGGGVFIVLTLVSEGALLIVAAQAGFVDGPRVLANMAVDSWLPRRFGALSERLTAQNGILLMGVASLAALVYTKGKVDTIVDMYSINVFVTFSLSMFGMLKSTLQSRGGLTYWRLRVLLFLVAFLFCVTILAVTLRIKFMEGAWVTVLVTGGLVVLCLIIRRHYDIVTEKLRKLYSELDHLPPSPTPAEGEPDPAHPLAVILVGGYGGLGIHTFLTIHRSFPYHFKGVMFLSVGVIDSKEFKGEGTVEALRESVEGALRRYVSLALAQGMKASYRLAIGTDAVAEAEKLCLEVGRQFPQTTYFAGKVLFHRESWYQNILHNETAFAIQKRLQWAGKTVVIVPARVA